MGGHVIYLKFFIIILITYAYNFNKKNTFNLTAIYKYKLLCDHKMILLYFNICIICCRYILLL